MGMLVERGMDIDEKLNEIIFKYHLDDVYPDYKKMLQAEKLVEKLVKSWIGKGKIACIVTCESDIHHWKHFLRDGQDVEFIRCENRIKSRNVDEAYGVRKMLDGKNWEEYADVYILSMEGSFFVKRWLRTHGVRHVFIYDYFAVHDLFFSKDWDALLADSSADYWFSAHLSKPERHFIALEIINATEEWRVSTEPSLKKLNWKKAFFLALYIRDFCLAEKLIQNCPVDEKTAKTAWNEIVDLLDNIRNKIKECNKRHILLLWTDAVSYEEIEQISFLADKKKCGICFDNMFTVIGNTNPTLKTMFCQVDVGGYLIKKISSENSPVYAELGRHGYDITMLGGYWEGISCVNQSDKYHQRWAPVSLVLWDFWRNMIRAEKPCFFCVHELLETHFPFVTADLTDEMLGSAEKRFAYACEYLSEQYHFFLDTLPQCMVKIYMTDHGIEQYCTRHHVFFVVENGTQPCNVNGMCTYYDFDKIIKKILSGKLLGDKEIVREYVKVQGLDWYSLNTNAVRIKQCWAGTIEPIGYCGVIDEKYIYLKFNNGIEWMAKRGYMGEEPNLFSSRIDAPKEIDKYREKLGNIPELPLAIQKKLKYAKYLQKAYENARPRNLKKQRLLNEWIGKYSKGSLAIRTGGVNAVGFYDLLSPDNRERIACFIDRDSTCKAVQRGMKVFQSVGDVPPEIKGIVFVSYKFLREVKNESMSYSSSIEILNPFEYLKSKGMVCKTGIAEYELTAEDCDVGFPFDEIDEEI